MVVAGRGDAPMLRSARSAVRRRHAIAFGLAAFPSLIVLFALNTRLYGHPFQSGYGRAADLFSVDNLWPNLQHYGQAVFETQLGLPLLGILAVLLPKPERAIVWLALGISAATVGVYACLCPSLPGVVGFRFLLPALAPLTVLAIAVLSIASRLLSDRHWSVFAIVMLTVTAIVWFGLKTARTRQVFELQQLESRFRRAGEVVRDELPANAIVIAVWQSGTVRFHAGRMSLL